MHTLIQSKYTTAFKIIRNIGIYFAYTEIYSEIDFKLLTISLRESFFILVTHFEMSDKMLDSPRKTDYQCTNKSCRNILI